ncbi:pyridine nucleotide-disulfide oxidoreductase [Mycolicibacterium agri]|uniref:Oxidoreductase n=1 Tax=Mycolicibacterium agri TaxID=36811 RepID=A0A2A7N110_MYCAG|nr:FAD-dependent oxidoreductase [Mycolicibacterium agri]PEG37499.1 pyridine nucleotide-disulfide oxidoreductase [Mycolicibacterium agri]GFG50925.1 oxidoreductase [Mycolicibacterium agri]
MSDQHVAVAIVGGGPSGLTAAAALAGQVDGEVLVIEREAETGGIPRHSDHPGYGMRDLKRFISGPAYARRLTAMAQDAGALLETEAMVTGWAGNRALRITSPRGVRTVTADAVVLATGARERPRPARLVPGDRADGVYTTGQLQNLVHIHHADVGRRALIVGAELVSWSAVLTLREAGCATVGMVSAYPQSEAYAAFRLPGRFLLDGPVYTRSRIVDIKGKGRVRSAVVEHLDTGERTTVDCDTVVFTGDWIPDHELARTGGLAMDAATRGPVVDAALRTSSPGVFAVGNLLHPVDTADGAALDGRHVAGAVSRWLTTRVQPPKAVRIRTDGPFRWVAPQLVSSEGGAAARGDLLFWVDEYRRLPKLRAVQDGRTLAVERTPWPAAPGRVYRAPWSLVADADPAGGDVTVSFA